MMDSDALDRVLNAYVERFVPAMLRWRYHLVLAKGGPEYAHLPEQSLFAHIINGVFGLAMLVRFLIARRVTPPDLDELAFRKALALYSIHEVHKLSDVEKLDQTEFSIPLDRLREEYERLGLSEFADVDEHLMRAANVHKRSPRQGDLLLSQEDDSLLWLLVRLADTLASVQTPEEASGSLADYLKRLGPAFAAKSPPGKYALYYHQIKDVRGVLTNTLHQAVAQQLQADYDFFPLLYFATGTLYLGPSKAEGLDREALISDVVEDILRTLAVYRGSSDAVKDGLRRQKFDFERHVYSFADVSTLLEVVREETILAKPEAKIAIQELNKLSSKREDLPSDWLDTVESRFGITLLDPKEHKVFNEHWSRTRRYLLYVDTLLRDLNPTEDRLEWFLRVFEIPASVADNLRDEASIWARGGLGKYVLIIAYHFLKGPDFPDRPPDTLPPEQVLERLHRRVLGAFSQVDTHAGRQAAVAQLGFRQDLTAYLEENLHLSFAPGTTLTDDALIAYSKPKRRNPKTPFCALCSRSGEFIREARTGILDDFLQVFSNRMLPVRVVQGNRSWCPICHLEFILRKLTGLGLPSGAHYKNSYRIYLYVLPTFSFTSEHLRLFRKWLHQFQQVTNLPVRDYGQDAPGLPRTWLEKRELDSDWIEELMDVLDRQVAWVSERSEWSYGERVTMSQVRGQPHYYLITWEKRAGRDETDDTRIATRTEAWAKALLVAATISGLSSCKIYATERPYLPVADPADLKPTITLDSPPPALRGLLGGETGAVSLYGRERDGRSGLERVLDLSAALWTVTADVHAPNRPTKDKYIADRLGVLNVSPLAGATFYKEYSRLNDGQSPHKPLEIACRVLLEVQGGELMNLVEQIAEKSLAMALPRGTSGRGKARRYEFVFREGVEAMRKAFVLIPELRRCTLTSEPLQEETLTELKSLASGTLLKALERRQQTRRGEIFVRAWGPELRQLTGELIDLLVDEVFLNRAGGSFARFLRLENSLADGIYYYTDQNLSRMWKEYNQQKAARQAEATNNPQE